LRFEGGSAEIVGVVGTVRGQGSDLQVSPRAQMYWVDNGAWPNNQFAVRSSVPPETLIPAIRAQIHDLDPNQAIHSIATMDSLVDDAVSQPRLTMFLLAAFAGLSLLLAGVGLYGVITYLVTERTREIGVRMALGAQRRQILRLFIGQGMRWSLAGAVAGLITAVLLVRFLRSLLFEVAPYDPLVFSGVAVFLTVVVFLACYSSARRATKIDPIVALRYE
jgi:putative ABC transport system permease protein